MEKFIEVNDLKIFYTEYNETGKKTLFFIHGNSGSHRTWDQQVQSKLSLEFRIIAFDLPGHGSSSHSKRPADYAVAGTARLLGDAVKKLAGDEPYFLIGFCLGSNVVAEMLADNDISPQGIVLISTNVIGEHVPLESVFRPNPQLALLFKDECSNEEISEFWSKQGVMDPSQLRSFVTDYQNVHNTYRSTLAATVATKDYSNEIELIKERNVATLIIFGQDDNLVNIDYLDEQDLNWSIKKISNAGHLVHFDAAEEVNKLIADFCKFNLERAVFHGKLQKFH